MWSQKQQARLKVAKAFKVCWAWFHGSVMGLFTTEPCLVIVINRATRVRFPVGWVDAEQVSLLRCTALEDLGGGRAGNTPPPMGPNSFVFTYIFTEKHPHRGSTPPTGPRPPTGNPGSATVLNFT